MDILDIMRKYSEGTMEPDEANEHLKDLGAGKVYGVSGNELRDCE